MNLQDAGGLIVAPPKKVGSGLTRQDKEGCKSIEDKPERRVWTPDEVVKLRQMVSDRKSGLEIAAYFDRPAQTIYTKLSALGLKLKAPDPPSPHEWAGLHTIPKETGHPEAAPVNAPETKAAPETRKSIDMLLAIDLLRSYVQTALGAEEIVAFGADKDEARAAVLFDAHGLRYKLLIEELR